MNNIQNYKTLGVSGRSSLVRVWRSTDVPGIPLVGIRVHRDTAKLSASFADPSSDEIRDYASVRTEYGQCVLFGIYWLAQFLSDFDGDFMPHRAATDNADLKLPASTSPAIPK